jgi:mannose-6-phosphate isomerase-like protein (cupin superfamily)
MKLRLKPGYKHTPIKHLKTSELFFVIKGTVVGIINGKHRQFTKGEGAYLPPLTPHAFTAGPRGVEVLSFFFPSLDMRSPDIIACQ